MTAEEVRRTAIPGTVRWPSRSVAPCCAARALSAIPSTPRWPSQADERLFHGKIVDVERRMLGGFARGVLVLEGEGLDDGRAIRIDFQNENLIARSAEGEILAVVPDLIWLVDEDTAEPIRTEIVRTECGSWSSEFPRQRC